MIEIQEAKELPEGFDALREASAAEGWRLLARLEAGWRSGENRFDGPGEGLFAAREAGTLLGVGGVSRDPYLDDPDGEAAAATGRVRHLYVDPAARRRGVGRGLMDAILARATTGFARLRLNTDTADGDRFYRSLGFVPTDEAGATHVLEGGALTRERIR